MLHHLVLSLAAWPFAAVGGLCLEAATDGGGAAPGGAAPLVPAAADPGAPAATDTDPSADPGAGDPASAAGVDPGDETDELDDVDVATHLPEASVRTRLRKAQRILAKQRPYAERFRGPDGQYLPADQVDRIFRNAQEFDGIDRVLRMSPRAVQVLLEEQRRLDAGEPEPAAAAAASTDPADAPFDASKHPFETETPEGKAFLEYSRRLHESERVTRQLQQKIATLESQGQQGELKQLDHQWKTATLTAATEVDEAFRPMFIRGVYREFQLLQAQGRLSKTNAKTVIDRELAEVRAHKRGATRQTTSRQSAAAVGNTRLPATLRPGVIQPAAATATSERLTVADGRKTFLAKYR